MTETRAWLESRQRPLRRVKAGSGALRAVGLVLFAWAFGLTLARLGVYGVIPAAVLIGWVLAGIAVAWGVRGWMTSRRAYDVAFLADVVERHGGRRRGSVRGMAAWEPTRGYSDGLAGVADRRTAEWLNHLGDESLTDEQRRATRAMRLSAGGCGVAIVAFLSLGPASAASASFWKPVDVLMRSRLPVTLTVDRALIRRGENVGVFVEAPGRREASLWVRAPGEAWRARPLSLDTAGRAAVTLEALDSDRYLRAESRGKSSDVVHVEVQLPALLTDLELMVRFPGYLDRADELIAPGDEPQPIPVGSRVMTEGRATVPLGLAVWIAEGDTVALDVSDNGFSGALPVRRSGTYELIVEPGAGGSLDEPAPRLMVVAVPDSAPMVAVPVPGADTIAPLSLRQPLLIDARDDHGLAKIELLSWRVSRFGERDSTVRQTLPLPEEGTDRAVLQAMLDLNERGYLPGDTAYFQVRAWDNAPTPNVGSSRAFALRLPNMAELRSELRAESRAVDSVMLSLATRQERLARELEGLAAERERGASDQLPFSSVERAQELLDEQRATSRDAEELRQALDELGDAAWSAGLTDPEFHDQLRELRQLLDQALSDELTQRLAQLQESLSRLDASDVRDALRNLAEAARRFQEELERSRELYERAALEGEMTTLAQDADELAQSQRDWNAAAQEGVDSALAALEEALAQRADSLGADLEQIQAVVDSMGGSLDQSMQGAQQASTTMRQAALQAQEGQSQRAQQSGQSASESLDQLSQELRDQRDQMREAWREEVMAAMDAAVVETAELALQQASVAEQLRRGETGGEVRSQQAAVREGVDRVMERIEGAAGKNALVSPRLGTTLGLSQMRMSQTLEQLQRPSPNSREAAESAGEALDALNSMIYALLQTQDQIQRAESGSGLQEAMEQLAQMAEQQGAMNGETGNMLTMAPTGEMLMQQLQSLAQRERALSQELERMSAEGEVGSAEQMAEEAREIARQLEAGQLDRPLTERQERLFRRLLDAGRSLRSDEEDQRKERVSESADPSTVRLPTATGEVGTVTPRYRVPSWEELRALSPEARRLILDYFRRLNERRP